MSNEFEDWKKDATLENIEISYNNAMEAGEFWYANELQKLIKDGKNNDK